MDMDILECLIAMTLRSIKKLIAQLMNGNIFPVIALRNTSEDLRSREQKMS